MDALRKVQAAIKKFLGLVIPPAVPEYREPAEPRATAAAVPFSFHTPEGMPEAEARKLAEDVRKTIEAKTGKPMQLICLGVIKPAPCDCPQCQRQRAAQWN